MSLSQITTSLVGGTPRRSPVVIGLLVLSVLVLAITLVWTFLGMRSVMDVGGACAEGGPYEIAQPCPDGAVLLSVGIPLLLISAMLGSAMAVLAGAPTLLLPMWAALFGSLGWNFLEYGFTADDGLVWGWVVCGVVFELMALPAVGMIVAGSHLVGLVPRTTGEETRSWSLTWWLGYAALGVAGVIVGTWTFHALT